MFVPSSEGGGSAVSFDGYRVIVPCVSVGNVAQLTVDLLINKLKLVRVGYLDDDSLLPLVGNDAFDHTGPAGLMHTAGEVYSSSELQTAVVQLRTPIVKGCKNSFCTKLLSWIKSSKFSEVVLLTSSYAHERRDVQIRGEPFRFLLTPLAGELYPSLSQDLGWTSLEPRGGGEEGQSSGEGVLTESQLFLPGSGLARLLYSKCCSEDVRMVLLVAFCSQGDNIPDAVTMATRMNAWLNLAPVKETARGHTSWTLPSSWSLMYGGPSPDSIF